MVVYRPPDRVIMALGTTHRAEPLLKAGTRIQDLITRDIPVLHKLGVPTDEPLALKEHLQEVQRMFKDPRAQKHDTPLQMAEAGEIMAQIRGWFVSLRLVGALNLSTDAPSLNRLASPTPELAEGYARDLLAELDQRLQAAADLKPRLQDAGMSRTFLSRGRKLSSQLKTAIGPKDFEPSDFSLLQRRLYMRKGLLYLRVKRATRAGKAAFITAPERARQYHMREVEPIRVIPILPPNNS